MDVTTAILDALRKLTTRVNRLETLETAHATDADTVDLIHAATTATANKLLALDADKDLELGTGDVNSTDATHTGGVNVGSATAATAGQAKGSAQALFNQDRCRVYNSADHTIADDSITALTWNSERFDSNTMHDTVTNPSRITIKTAGIYLINALVYWDYNATGVRELFIQKNGPTALANRYDDVPGGSQFVSCIYALAVNDYVEAYVYQTSGGNLNTFLDENYTHFEAILLSAS